MKTKTFFMLCLFFGIGLTQLSAQNSNSEGTKSYSYWMNWGFYADVKCDGVWVDYIEGELYWHFVDHYKDGVWEKGVGLGRGEIRSEKTGENFEIKELDKWSLPKSGIYSCNTFLKGDMGSNYMISWQYWDGQWTILRAGCPGNEIKKK